MHPGAFSGANLSHLPKKGPIRFTARHCSETEWDWDVLDRGMPILSNLKEYQAKSIAAILESDNNSGTK